MSLLIVTPDYPAPIEFSPSLAPSYPFDSILLVPPGDRGLYLLADALAAIQQAPYLPLVVGTSVELGGPLRFAIGEYVVEAITVVIPSDTHSAVERVRCAVRGRGCPSKEQLVRLLSRAVGGNVSVPLEKALTGSPMTRPEQRVLIALTGLGPTAWRSLYCCLQGVADAWSESRTVESLAEAYKVSPKTVWVRCRRFFGITWLHASAFSTWEALVHRAITIARRPSSGGIADPLSE